MDPAVLAFVGRFARFAACFVVLYLAVLFLAANVRPGGMPGMGRTSVPSEAPTYGGQSSYMLREIEDVRRPDVLWIGSSHAIRTFDPRFFDRHGLRTFIIGTTAQTPLNSYHLLRQRIERIRPRWVVLELYWNALTWDGLESTLDLIANDPRPLELVPMIAATRDLRAMNALLRRLVDLRRPNVSDVQPNLFRGDRYVGRGYVEKAPDFVGEWGWDPGRMELAPRQLRYIRRLVELARRHDAQVALVVQPLPGETLERVDNREEIERTLAELAEEIGVPYIDFNGRLDLDDRSHFFDPNHLNQAGVERFLPELLRELTRIGVTPE